MDLTVNLRRLHKKQLEIKRSQAKRKVIRAGRRGGKTVLAADITVDSFLDGQRVLYGTPTDDQLDAWWREVKNALSEPLEAGIFYKNETKHIIEIPGTETRIRGKTAFNADTLRGDYADLLILDEYQDMKEDAWNLVGAPMLLDNDGDAIFIFTKKSMGRSRHADLLFRRAAADETGRWAVFSFSSHDNPHISDIALEEITEDMTDLAYRMEIGAEDIQDDPNALWNRGMIEENRVISFPDLSRVYVGIDPSGSTGTEVGIVVGGTAWINGRSEVFILGDYSIAGKPNEWGRAAVTAYHLHSAGRILGESNFGGDMVENTMLVIDPNISYKPVHASRGKAIRAEPVSAMYEKGRVHHVGTFGLLEDEMCTWIPGVGMKSPNRLDAMVWVVTEALGISQSGGIHV